jgi:outer membrane protein assembly factor BamB
MGDGLIFTSSGFEKTTLRVVRAGGKGDVTKTHIAWEQRRGVPTLSSLLYVSPYLYTITSGGVGCCYNGQTGELVWQERIGGNHSASPVYADGHIYFLSEQGETVVLKAGPTFQVVSRNTIGEKCQASIAISQGDILIRSQDHLFCARKP